ncbi:hypothetical protein CCZ01_07505 [Helicobacter monodelphidis]|uniref:DUF814 domain-containing protein n=1 Tax=Helicobacter sp. 15-1451 TaxID=2004995 RepID=UPI000DCF418A|nr:DUF814 domain-containing protein [Helicobacter sp. 15-1451]RAX57004.1 hypothetical protein CCZ01_07505 [Helicobacter sp. 15-1451]
MKLTLLKRVILEFSRYRHIHHIKRVGDNLFKLELDKDIFYIDLIRSSSNIFIAPSLLAIKEYNAPFDLNLMRYCNRATIQKVEGDGENRILRFHLLQQGSYKQNYCVLQFEFTGRNTNAILIKDGIVLDALRHISHERSFRVVKIGEKLANLPQPKVSATTIADSGNFMQILERNYKQRIESQLEQNRIVAIRRIDKKIENISKKISEIPLEKNIQREAIESKKKAQILIENLYKLPARITDSHLILESDSQKVHINIPESAKSYSHTAQILFEDAKYLERKAKHIHIEREHLEQKQKFYITQQKIITQCQSIEDIAIYSQKQQRQQKGIKKEEFESFFVEGVKISFGKNRQENIALLKAAKAEDIWMHIRSIPSSHMILRSFNKKIAMPILLKAAEILVSFTQQRGGNYEIDYTRRKFVKMTEGANVQYSKYETITLKKEI